MSGGSWSYAYKKINDIAENLDFEPCALRRALGKHMHLIAAALKAIEWVDSSDSSHPKDTDAIKAVFGDMSDNKEIEILLDDAKDIIEKLSRIVGECSL